MTDIPKIGPKNPAAVLRDVSEKIPNLRSLVIVGVYKDGSADVWMSDEPAELERSAVLLMRVAQEEQGRYFD